MTILYLLTRDLGATGVALRVEHEKGHRVEVIDLRGEVSYGRVVDSIASADRVICW